MKFWKTFLRRLKGQTPIFFKKIRMFMAGILAAGISLLPFKEDLPERLKTIPAYLIIIGTLGTINNSLPVVDKKKMNKPRLTKRQEYYNKANGLPLFNQFAFEHYRNWIQEHEKAYLIKVNKKELKGIEDYNKFDDYLRSIAYPERNTL